MTLIEASVMFLEFMFNGFYNLFLTAGEVKTAASNLSITLKNNPDVASNAVALVVDQFVKPSPTTNKVLSAVFSPFPVVDSFAAANYVANGTVVPTVIGVNPTLT